MQPVLVQVLETGINWSAVEAIGSLGGLAIAIGVPAFFEFSRAQREVNAKRDRNRAAFRVLESVIGVLELKDVVALGEVDAMSAVLSNVDLAVLNSEAVSAVVVLRNRVAVSAAHANRELANAPNNMAPVQFDATAARADLNASRAAFYA